MNKIDYFNKIKNFFKFIIDFIIKFRYFLAIVLLIILVIFKINFSSITLWDNLISERIDQKQTDLIFGKPRSIRSDEWMVQTPFYLAQSEANLPINNKNYSHAGQNMIVAYNAPVKDLTLIGKPFNWGYLFLKSEYAFSFYWVFKLIGLCLLAFELAMILTKKNRFLSLLSSVWITFSPAVQWWFMQHLGDLIFYTLAIMVASYHFFINRNIFSRLLMSIILIICGSGFILVIYPAFQVLLAYLILVWIISIYFFNRKNIQLDIFDLIYFLFMLGSVSAILLHFYFHSKEALALTLNTVYPGKRVWLGGDTSLVSLAAPLINWLLPFRDISFNGFNNCELASFYHLLPVIIFTIPLLEFKDKIDKVIIIFMCYLSFLLIIMFIGLPSIVAKITLLSYTTGNRLAVVFHFVSMLCSIWYMNKLSEVKVDICTKKNRTFICLLSFSFFVFIFGSSGLTTLLGKPKTYVLILVIGLLVIGIVYRLRKIVYFFLALLFIISGMLVNPIVQGTGSINEKKLTYEIKRIAKQDPKSYWVSEGMLYNYLPTIGVKSINSVRFYPDMITMEKVSGHNVEQKNIYNRYAHIYFEVQAKGSTFDLLQPDVYMWRASITKLKKLHVKYILSKRDLLSDNVMSSNLKRIYGPDKDDWQVYELIH